MKSELGLFLPFTNNSLHDLFCELDEAYSLLSEADLLFREGKLLEVFRAGLIFSRELDVFRGSLGSKAEILERTFGKRRLLL